MWIENKPPEGYTEISPESFDDFLATCADYVRDAFAGGWLFYSFRHNGRRFAAVRDKENPIRVYFDSQFLMEAK